MAKKGPKLKTEARSAEAPAKSQFSSRVGSGRSLWLDGDVDGRSSEGRRFREIVISLAEDRGGSDNLTEAQRQLIRRAATLSLACEKAEAGLVAGNEFDMDMYSKATNTLSRTLAQLGIYRSERPAIDLQSYLREADEAEAA